MLKQNAEKWKINKFHSPFFGCCCWLNHCHQRHTLIYDKYFGCCCRFFESSSYCRERAWYASPHVRRTDPTGHSFWMVQCTHLFSWLVNVCFILSPVVSLDSHSFYGQCGVWCWCLCPIVCMTHKWMRRCWFMAHQHQQHQFQFWLSHTLAGCVCNCFISFLSSVCHHLQKRLSISSVLFEIDENKDPWQPAKSMCPLVTERVLSKTQSMTL